MSYDIKGNTFFNSYLDSLSHYGIAGMKWGVWNDETQRKYRGGSGKRGVDSKLSNKNLDVKTSEYTDATKRMKSDLKAANLGGKLVSFFKKDRNLNTGYCTAAYLLRQSGYDVAAKTSKVSFGVNDILDLYKDLKLDLYAKGLMRDGKVVSAVHPDKIKGITEELLAQGEGASGFVTGAYARSLAKGNSNGRTLAYTVANGKLHIIDGQLGRIYSGKSVENSLKSFGTIMTLRTDTKQVNEKAAQKFVGSTSLLKVTDNEFDKAKIALTSAAVVGSTIAIGGAITFANKSIPAAAALQKLSLSPIGPETIHKINERIGIIKPLVDAGNKEAIKANRALKAARNIAENEAYSYIDGPNNTIKGRLLAKILIPAAGTIGGTTVTAAAIAATPVAAITKRAANALSKDKPRNVTNVSDTAYEKAARNYLKEHPNSTMSVAELAAKYKKEWTEGNK